MKTSTGLAALALCTILASVVGAQKTTQIHPGQGGSPHVRTAWAIDGANISIEYGRPSLNGRKLGRAIAPYKREWRTGADEATTFKTDKPLKFGTLVVPAGTYTLYTIPDETEWVLAFSTKIGEWGIPVQKDKDLGRVKMAVSATAKPVEQLTFVVDDTPTGGTLTIEWGPASASVPFTVG